ncbi:protein of unknown function DUF4112 [Metschnikowia aff. pulcherrima]|uniref:Uncharacterized protein n=1 Tax=Metschnikowia aff. pulcherrima TaxID=2163413 RepID=A0A4P6XLE1_9ASCO|nr:protein of unknown function DUF4112 [Metschnikowia aff. pulcherrima]
MSQLEEQLENIPGYDLAMDKYNDIMGEKFNNTDPFEDEDGNGRVLDVTKTTEKERKVWKRIQKLAWVHDKCFLGSCGVGMDCGIGLVPLAVFFLPGIGAIITYVIHARVISIAQNELYLPAKLVAKLQANILMDFLISLPPVIGAFLSWLNGCLTRNAGMIYVYLAKIGEKRAAGQAPVYIGPLTQERSAQNPVAQSHVLQGQNLQSVAETDKSLKLFKKTQPESKVIVGTQLSGVR